MQPASAASRLTALTEAFERLSVGRADLKVKAHGRAGPAGELIDPTSSLELQLEPPAGGARGSLHIGGSGATLRVWMDGDEGADEPQRVEPCDIDLRKHFRWNGIIFEGAEPMADVLIQHLERKVGLRPEHGRTN